MKRAVALFLVLVGLAAPAWGQTTRLDPAGISGQLLLGGRDVAEPLAKTLAELAGAKRASLAVVRAGAKESAAEAQRLKDLIAEDEVTITALTIEDWAQRLEKGERFTGAWLAGPLAEWRANVKRVRPLCQAFVTKGGVLCLEGDLAPLAASTEMDLLPDSRIGPPGPAAGVVGYEIEPNTVLWLKGRLLRALGDGKVTVRLAASKGLPARSLELRNNTQEDLTALRRAARARRESSFPPDRVVPPEVSQGTLVIVGGGGMPSGLFERFVACAGGKDRSHIVIFPTAQDPIPSREGLVKAIRNAGAQKVSLLKGRTRAEVDSPEFLATLREATGIWFDGGRQWRFVDAYEGTKAQELMFDVLRRDGVIGGSSAGATIQGDYLCRGSPFGNLEIRYESYERGLGFLPGVAIDQHFSERKRFDDMASLMKIYPQLLGIGIDETTAIVVRGHVAEVVGKGKAHFFDARRNDGDADAQSLAAGSRFDLKGRRPLEKN